MRRWSSEILIFLLIPLCTILPAAAAKEETGKRLDLPVDSTSPGGDEGSVFFVGNATLVIKVGAFTILTDPNFLHKGDHVHLGYGLKAERLTDPARELDQLPAIDFLLVSHLHEDHFDRVVEQKLDKSKPIITAGEAADKLKKKGFQKVFGLDKWQSITVTKGQESLTVTAMPAKHAPLAMQPMMPEVIGSMIEYRTPDRKKEIRIYITGDTLVHRGLEEIHRRYPDVDIGLFHLGGTRIFGILLTLDGRRGAEAVRIIQPQTTIPVHYNDYSVFKSSLEDFKSEVAKQGYQKQIVYLNPGETYKFRLKDVPPGGGSTAAPGASPGGAS